MYDSNVANKISLVYAKCLVQKDEILLATIVASTAWDFCIKEGNRKEMKSLGRVCWRKNGENIAVLFYVKPWYLAPN